MRKRIWIGALAALLALSCGGALAACGGETVKLPEFDYDYTEEAESFGDGISVDGKLDEAHWNGGRAFTAHIKNTTVDYEMRSYFGEKGVYFGFDIKDDAVYYSEVAEIYNNSGVELLVGSPEDNTITYEIDLNAGGRRMLRKFTGDVHPFLNWFSDLHSAVFVDGTLNGTCRGYSAELYLPYNLFHADNSEEPLDYLLVNPAIVRGTSDPQVRGLWYSIGLEERGIEHTVSNPNWYQFKKDVGLVADEVTLSAGAHGALSGRAYNIPGDRYTVTVKPEEGYCIDTLTFGGENVTDKISYQDGTAVYSAKMSEPFTVEASFKELPSASHTVSGTVSAAGALSNVKMYAVCLGAYREIAVGADGSYSAELPEGVWTLYCSADGYLTYFDDADVRGNVTKDITLFTNYLTPSGSGEWDFTYLGGGIVTSTASSWWHYATHNSMKGSRIFASARLVLPAMGGDPRVGLYLTTGPDDLFVGLSYEKGGYRMQVIHGGVDWIGSLGSDNVVDLVPELPALAQESGVPLSYLYEKGKISIWVGDVAICRNIAIGYGFTESLEVTPGIIATGTAGTSLRGLSFTKLGETGYPIGLTKEGAGTLSVEGGKTSFETGEPVVLNVLPDEGYMLTVLTVNGQNRLADVTGGNLTVDTAGMNILNVRAVFTKQLSDKGSLNATVKFGGEGAEGIEVALYNQTAQTLTVEVTGANGAVSFSDLPLGKYTVYVNAKDYPDGSENSRYSTSYSTLSEELVVNGETVKEYTLAEYDREKAMQEKYAVTAGADFALKDIEDGKVVYLDKGQGGGEAHMKTTIAVGADEDFYLEAVLKDQDGFVHTDGAGIRYGYTIFADGAADYHLTFAWHPDTNAYKIEFTDWSNYDVNNYPALSTAQIAAWKGEGLRIGIARIGGVFRAYVETDGVMKDFYHETNAGMANAALNLGFACWWQVRGAEYNNLSWEIGSVPVTVDVAKSENVEVEAQGTPALGKDITLIFTPEAGYIPSEVKVNGELKNPVKGENGVYTLTLAGYVASLKLTVEATFVELKEADLTLKITLHRLGIGEDNRLAIPDGTAVGIDGSGIERTAQASGGKAVFEGIAAGNYTITVEGYRSAVVEVTATEEKEITLEYEINATVNPEFFDLSEINDGAVTYLDKGQTAGEAHIKLDKTTGTGDFFLSAVLKKQDSFIMDDVNGLRLGFTLYSDQPDLHMTFLKNGGGENYAFAANNWGDIGKDAPLPAEAVEAWKTTGLRVALVRFRGVLYTCAEIGGSWRAILSVEGAKVAETDFNYGFAGWFQARGAKFTELAYGNDVPQAVKDAFKLKVTQNVQGATLTTDPEAPYKGDDVKLIFKPQEGYLPKNVMVGEYSVLDRLTREDNGDYTVTLTNRQWDIDVVAEFGPAGEATVALIVKLHKLGTGENNLSAIGDGVTVKLVGVKIYEAVSGGGKADFGKVDTGMYKVQVEGYFDGELTVDVNVEREIVLEYKLYASKTDLIDADGINDGNLTFKNGDGQKLWLEQTVAPDEDFLLIARFHDYFMDNLGDDVRLGFKVGADLDNDGNGDPWDDLWTASETLSLCLKAIASNGGAAIDFPPYWGKAEYHFAEDDVAALKGETGVRIGFARIGGKYHILVGAAAEKGGNYVYVFDGDAWAFNSVNQDVPLKVGFFSGHNRAQDIAAKVSDISLTVVKTGEGIKNAALEKYFRLSVEKNVEGAAVALDPETPYAGDSVKITFTPTVEGDKPKKVMVNGTSVLDRLSEGEGVYTVSVEDCRHALTIVAEFANEQEYEVSLNVKLHKFGNGAENLRAVIEADNLRLVGPVTRTAAVEGEIASFGPVPKGEYQITVDGYKTQTLTVEEAIAGREITLEYDYNTDIRSATGNFDFSQYNDGKVSVNNGAGQKLWLKDTVDKTEDFFVSAVFSDVTLKNLNDGTRFGFIVACDRDNDGGGNPWIGGLWEGATEALYACVRLNQNTAEGDVQFEYPQTGNWEVTRLSQKAVSELASPEGLRIGLARINEKYYLFAIDSEGNGAVAKYVGDNWAFNTCQDYANPLWVGIFSEHDQGAGKVFEFSGLTLEKVASGGTFQDSAVEALFKENL